MKLGRKKKRLIIGIPLLVFAVVFYFMLPKPLFNSPYSTVVYGQNNVLLGARIAEDGQWRFPPEKNLPAGYVQAVLHFEDEYFHYHPGINPFALARAMKANLKAKRVVQGGSTISMQVVRMALENQPRTYGQKLKEILLALRIELAFSKDEILELYAAHAPFGGNVVGLEAAAWRYFNRPPQQLSTAEYALLAVLPNAPTALRPGKNHGQLLKKRNALLKKLFLNEVINEEEYQLALLEELPNAPHALPNFAPHITQEVYLNKRGQIAKTTIDAELQQRSGEVLQQFYKRLKQNGVNNAGLMITEVKTGNVIAYHGNTHCGVAHSQYVDVCKAPRSSGSILKPFLFNAMQQSGQLLPNQLVADVPTFLSGFKPENYSRSYEGAVPASEALARSLNVPAVLELKAFGVGRFKAELKHHGFSTISRTAENYGLSLILGGAEVTLWDISQAYLGLAQNVKRGQEKFKMTSLHQSQADTLKETPKVDPGAAYLTLNALRTANHNYSQSGVHAYIINDVAWKTGTSYGFRDAWAVGVTPQYVVAVWVGNADGEGRPGVIGAEAAAPIMFETFSILNEDGNWFVPPYNHMQAVNTCAKSGHIAGQYCEQQNETWSTLGSSNAQVCTYHQPILLNLDETHRLKSICAEEQSSLVKSWFVLPPAIEYYYKKVNPGYRELPPFAPRCKELHESKPMQFIYPTNYQKVYAAKQIDGNSGTFVFKLAHRDARKRVYWHANDEFLGETKEIHDLPVHLAPGQYTLKVVDEDGHELTQSLEVL